MNKNKAIAKINKYGKYGSIITVVMIVIVSILTLVTLVAAVGTKFIPDDLFKINLGTQAEVIINPSAIDSDVDAATFDQITYAINSGKVQGGLNLGAVSMELNTAEVVGDVVVCKTTEGTGELHLTNVGNVLLLVVVSLLLTLISTIFGFKFCKSIEKCESPFEDNVIKKMRYMAFSLLPWAVFSSIPKYAVNNLFNNNLKVNLSLDMNIILIVLVILALTVVFKYGAILQQESDETL